jgi:hypothetical protein
MAKERQYHIPSICIRIQGYLSSFRNLGDFETLLLGYHGIYINLKLVLNERKINHIPRLFPQNLRNNFSMSSPCKKFCDYKRFS